MVPQAHARQIDAARPLFRADWEDVLFMHFEMDTRQLQPSVPFELDVREGRAYVSLVAFTQRRLRPGIGGRVAAVLAAPLSDHAFLNVRTYVRHRGERGIFFIAEWIPNRLAAWIGPRTYGLPYRLGELALHNDLDARNSRGRIRARGRELRYAAVDSHAGGACSHVAAPDSLDEFLLERYVAFTSRHGVRRRFDVAHMPWPHAERDARLDADSLLGALDFWPRGLQPLAAHISPGVRDVVIGAPRRLEQPHQSSSCLP